MIAQALNSSDSTYLFFKSHQFREEKLFTRAGSGEFGSDEFLSRLGFKDTDFLDKFFKDKVVSGDVGCRKPDEEIFRMALERTKRRPEQCIFIDNSVSNLQAAAKPGIMPVLFNRDGAEYNGTVVNTFQELGKIVEGI